MRWSIVRLIWLREMRDQLRDRRTVFMIAVLPMLLYPLAGFGVMQLALGHLRKQTVIGIQGRQYLPPLSPRCTAFSPAPVLSWLTLTPAAPGAPLSGIERACTALALEKTRRSDRDQDYPPLLFSDGEDVRFPSLYLDNPEEAHSLILLPLDVPTPDADLSAPGGRSDPFLAQVDRSALDSHQVDFLLVVPANFEEILRNNGRPPLYVLTREDDDRSRLVDNRLTRILQRWKQQLKEVRFLRQGLSADYDNVIELRDAARTGKAVNQRAADELLAMLVRIFPFVLVMWSLAGALYPAVDLCAGEKERGTMETLLISPAERTEIVLGKFLATTVFAFASVVWNVLWLTGGALLIERLLGSPILNLPGMAGCVLLGLPLAMLFSAVSLALGVFAKSTKEGQYYLMPLLLLTMPLAFWSMTPGAELTPGNCWIPVTGAMLLQQRLLSVSPGPVPWGYVLPVFGALVGWVSLALAFAVWQFRREEVLFRETTPRGVGVFRRLFRARQLPG